MRLPSTICRVRKKTDVVFVEFETFRSELKSLEQALTQVSGKTVRDHGLRERFRTLFRVWVSVVQPTLTGHLRNRRDLFKLTAEVERLARLTSKYKSKADYRRRLRTASQLADNLVLLLPTSVPARAVTSDSELFVAGIPDLPTALVPNPIIGWRSNIEAFLNEHPFDKSVFVMIRYRRRTQRIIAAIKDALRKKGFFAVVASDHAITDDLYNPVACLLCCSRGIAVFDTAERREKFNPNVAYELGMLHLLGRPCLILKHDQLDTLQTDILMKVYVPFRNTADVRRLVTAWENI